VKDQNFRRGILAQRPPEFLIPANTLQVTRRKSCGGIYAAVQFRGYNRIEFIRNAAKAPRNYFPAKSAIAFAR
jgi:hypothetical protein